MPWDNEPGRDHQNTPTTTQEGPEAIARPRRRMQMGTAHLIPDRFLMCRTAPTSTALVICRSSLTARDPNAELGSGHISEHNEAQMQPACVRTQLVVRGAYRRAAAPRRTGTRSARIFLCSAGRALLRRPSFEFVQGLHGSSRFRSRPDHGAVPTLRRMVAPIGCRPWPALALEPLTNPTRRHRSVGWSTTTVWGMACRGAYR